MNILVVGSGGREHAIIKKIKENKNVKNIYVYAWVYVVYSFLHNLGFRFAYSCVESNDLSVYD